MTKWILTAALAAVVAAPAAADPIQWGFYYGYAGVGPAEGTSLKFGTGTEDTLGGPAVWFGDFGPAGQDVDRPTVFDGPATTAIAVYDGFGGLGSSDLAAADSPRALGASDRFRGSFQLMDMASSETATLTFLGTLTDRGLGVFPTATITDGANQTAFLGGNRFSVGFHYAGDDTGGSFTVSVQGFEADGGAQTPEPASLVLAGVGLVGAGFVTWRKRRTAARAG